MFFDRLPGSLDQGMLLCLLSSVMCILGCLLITTDILYRKLLPSLSKKYPFSIEENTSFLIASLSLSSGSLIFTSMFKLLPESQSYYEQVTYLKKNIMMAYLLGFYLLGICICGALNALIHFCTSESVVHCVHEEEHKHSVEPESEDEHEHSSEPEPEPTETTALLVAPPMVRGPSLVDISLKKLKTALHKPVDVNSVGICHGYDGFEKCVLQNPYNYIHTDGHDTPKPVVPTRSQSLDTSGLHYCDLPTLENLIYFQQQFHQKHQNSSFMIHSPLIRSGSHESSSESYSHSHSHDDAHSDEENAEHEHHHSHSQNHENHANRHHHHIITPLSRLLSIGLQTILAITLHKFPEGFIMYSTSKANPTLGLTIFLSLAIHNFVEGFTMCLPLYLALKSRLKLILISGLIGGMAQPLGAVIAWLFFKNKNLNSTDSLNILFGNLMALTSGFLSIIGFQMFASALGFGGTQRYVLIWLCIGIALIGSSYILVGDME